MSPGVSFDRVLVNEKSPYSATRSWEGLLLPGVRQPKKIKGVGVEVYKDASFSAVSNMLEKEETKRTPLSLSERDRSHKD